MRSYRVRGRLPTVIVIIVLLSLSAHPTSATNTQGLEWGVASGSRFYYQHEFHYPDGWYGVTAYDGNELVYVNVTGLTPLPDYADSWSDVFSSYHVYWANGTELPLDMRPDVFWIVPIGNWSFITELTYKLTENLIASTFETITTWSTNITVEGPLWIFYYRMIISRLDGAPLYCYNEYIDTEGTEQTVYTQEFIRVNETTHSESFPEFLLAGIGVSSVAVILVIAVYAYKSKMVD
jgi:hypothetical protein